MSQVVDKVIKDIDKKFEGRIKTLDAKKDANAGVLGFVPTNNLAVDYVIGRKGLPIGRIVEIYGKSGSGKSSLIASIIGAAQAAGIHCALIDAENSYDPSWARRFNVDTENLILIEPETLEESFDITRSLIKDFRAEVPGPLFIAYDSVSALPSNSEVEQEDSSGSSAQAEHARIISRELRKIGGMVKDQNICLTFVSQLKDNPRATWGDAESILGGSAIKFHAGLRIKLTKMKTLKVKDEAVGITIQVTSIKNKFTAPYKVHTFDLYYDDGIHPKEILLDFAVEQGIVAQSSGWYEFEGSKYRKDKMVELLDDSLFETIYEKLGM